MDWLPAAIRDPHPRSFPWQNDAPAKGVLHTTEGSGWPSYDGWTIMPHATVMPTAGEGITIRQHLPFSQGSFALVHSGAEPTNGAHAFQFELIGTCDPSARGMYFWPNADDKVLLDLFHKVIKPLSDAFAIPLHALPFEAYPKSYGANGVRLTQSQWHAYSGWLGHQHVAENDHGDPGAFPWDRLMKLAGPTPKPPAPPGDGPIRGPLKYGSTGPDVWRIQHRLDKQLGVHLTVDGDFGRATLIEVENWQRKHHLVADGVVGPATAKSMGFTYAAR